MPQVKLEYMDGRNRFRWLPHGSKVERYLVVPKEGHEDTGDMWREFEHVGQWWDEDCPIYSQIP